MATAMATAAECGKIDMGRVRWYRPVATHIEDMPFGYQTTIGAALWPAARDRLEALGHEYAAIVVGCGVFVYAEAPAVDAELAEDVKHLPGLGLAFLFRLLLAEGKPDRVELSDGLARLLE